MPTPMTISPEDERRHLPTDAAWWCEQWWFEAASSAVGLLASVTLFPNRKRAWFWAAVVGPGRNFVSCRDDSLAPPGWPLEVRGSGLWSHAICETPVEHWTVAMEAFAVGFEDRLDAWGDERGDRVGLAFDLEWENSAASRSSDAHGYWLECRVSGDLQIDHERFELDTSGRRSHRWGEFQQVFEPKPLRDLSDRQSIDEWTAPVLIGTPTGVDRRLARLA